MQKVFVLRNFHTHSIYGVYSTRDLAVEAMQNVIRQFKDADFNINEFTVDMDWLHTAEEIVKKYNK